MRITSSLLQESLADVFSDTEELLYLFSASHKQLETFQKDIKKEKKHIPSFTMLFDQATYYKKMYEDVLSEIKTLQKTFLNASPSETLLLTASEKITRYYDRYRTLQAISAGLITASDWQSPSFAYSLTSLAGRQTGKIVEHITDYKRDRHLDAFAYEAKFKKEYIDGLFKLPIHVYLTNSGMSAISTALSFLIMEKKITSPVLLGKASYFELKKLTKQMIQKDVIEFDEHDIQQFYKLFDTVKPSVVVLDSLCNSYNMATPNIEAIFLYITKHTKHPVYILLDNTNVATTLQPISSVRGKNKNVSIVVIESLNKYYQFGADRTSAGVIYAWGKDTIKLQEAREHMGTIILDASCYMLPTPNRNLLEKRLRRYERNVSLLTTALSNYLAITPSKILRDVAHPTLSHHPAFSWAKKMPFHGSFFAFTWHKKYDTPNMHNRFIKEVLRQAKKQKVQITSGTSFGFQKSRIYLTSATFDVGKPFVRFSVGTENIYEIEKIKDVLIAAIKNL